METDHIISLLKKIFRSAALQKFSIVIFPAFACSLLLVTTSCFLSYDRSPRSYDQHLQNHEDRDYPDRDERRGHEDRNDYKKYNEKAQVGIPAQPQKYARNENGEGREGTGSFKIGEGRDRDYYRDSAGKEKREESWQNKQNEHREQRLLNEELEQRDNTNPDDEQYQYKAKGQNKPGEKSERY
jgi:hypothetical protein